MNETIPDRLVGYVMSLPQDHLERLKSDLAAQRTAGMNRPDMVNGMVRVGWPQDFSDWFVGLVVLHGTNFTWQPGQQTPPMGPPGMGPGYNAPQSPYPAGQQPFSGGPQYGPQQHPGYGPQSPYQYPPNAPYYRPGMQAPSTNNDVVLAWVFGSIGLIFCPIVFSTVGIVLGNRAASNGDSRGKAAMWFSVFTLIAGIAIGVLIRLGTMSLSRF